MAAARRTLRAVGLTAASGAAFGAGLGAMPALAAPAVYDLDPAHSFVHFEVLHFGTATLRGRFGPVQGTVTLDAAEGRGAGTGTGTGEIGLRIPTAGVDTGLKILDARLRQSDLLSSEAHPEVFFVASRLRWDGPRLAEVRGEFTFRGISQPLSLTALHYACRQDTRLQREVCGGDFEAHFNRGDFGASFGLPFVADRVRLVIQVEGVRR